MQGSDLTFFTRSSPRKGQKVSVTSRPSVACTCQAGCVARLVMAEGSEKVEEIPSPPWVVCLPRCCPEPSLGVGEAEQPCAKWTSRTRRSDCRLAAPGIHRGSRKGGDTDLPPLGGSSLLLWGPPFLREFSDARHRLQSLQPTLVSAFSRLP